MRHFSSDKFPVQMEAFYSLLPFAQSRLTYELTYELTLAVELTLQE